MIDRRALSILATRTNLSTSLTTFSFLLFFSLIFLATIPTARAQEYRGTILGQVRDPKGSMVPKATITAVGPQQTYTAKSSANGDYILPFVQPGT
jgi:hypothetical protein